MNNYYRDVCLAEHSFLLIPPQLLEEGEGEGGGGGGGGGESIVPHQLFISQDNQYILTPPPPLHLPPPLPWGEQILPDIKI